MVDVAETLTPATARGAFLMMQIEMEHERAALTAKRDSDAQDKQEKGATYLRLANTRLRSGALIEPPKTMRASIWKRRARSCPTIRRCRRPRARCRRSC